MSIWFYELLSPEALIGHVAVFLVVVAVAMPSLLLVRIAALAGGLVGVFVSSVVSYDRAELFWWGLLTIVALVRLVVRDPRGLFGRLSAEEKRFHQAVVPSLSRSQAKLLLRIGDWRDAEPGRVFTRAGENVSDLIYISEGEAEIVVDDHVVGEVGPGSLIGEIGVSTGEPATATTRAAGPVRYLAFATSDLYPFLDSHLPIQDAVELAVDRNLRDKLHRANVAAAHAGEAPDA